MHLKDIVDQKAAWCMCSYNNKNHVSECLDHGEHQYQLVTTVVYIVTHEYLTLEDINVEIRL